jgi:hypothetical protein
MQIKENNSRGVKLKKKEKINKVLALKRISPQALHK